MTGIDKKKDGEFGQKKQCSSEWSVRTSWMLWVHEYLSVSILGDKQAEVLLRSKAWADYLLCAWEKKKKKSFCPMDRGWKPKRTLQTQTQKIFSDRLFSGCLLKALPLQRHEEGSTNLLFHYFLNAPVHVTIIIFNVICIYRIIQVHPVLASCRLFERNGWMPSIHCSWANIITGYFLFCFDELLVLYLLVLQMWKTQTKP